MGKDFKKISAIFKVIKNWILIIKLIIKLIKIKILIKILIL
jgi:hypothetical protein